MKNTTISKQTVTASSKSDTKTVAVAAANKKMCLPFAKTHMELNQLTPEPWQLESTFPLQPGDSKP